MPKGFNSCTLICRNVVDTASNYRGGRGQIAVGAAVQAVMQVKRISRQMLFFSTKAGFVDATILQELLSRKAIGTTDIMGTVNCIHPACLEESLAVSLRSMRLETVSTLRPYISDLIFKP